MCGTVIGMRVGLLYVDMMVRRIILLLGGFAMALLTGALKTESDPEVKAEISRRLKLLEAKPIS